VVDTLNLTALNYQPPEYRMIGQYYPESDIWSAAVIIFELIYNGPEMSPQ
jgi:serine/threonine protein kinase